MVYGGRSMAAKIVRDLKSLPDTAAPIPGAKPPVTSFPVYDDPPSVEEVDDFLRFIRELRRGKPSRR
jgi:hypothetical protein